MKGENAIEIICDDKLRSSGALLRSVSDWFEEAMEHKVSVVKSEDYARISLHPVGKELSISLSETGAGFSQVLPIAVQNFVARTNDAVSKTLIIEQPELHLHPAVHGEIADLYLSTAKETSGQPLWNPLRRNYYALTSTHSGRPQPWLCSDTICWSFKKRGRTERRCEGNYI